MRSVNVAAMPQVSLACDVPNCLISGKTNFGLQFEIIWTWEEAPFLLNVDSECCGQLLWVKRNVDMRIEGPLSYSYCGICDWRTPVKNFYDEPEWWEAITSWVAFSPWGKFRGELYRILFFELLNEFTSELREHYFVLDHWKVAATNKKYLPVLKSSLGNEWEALNELCNSYSRLLPI